MIQRIQTVYMLIAGVVAAMPILFGLDWLRTLFICYLGSSGSLHYIQIQKKEHSAIAQLAEYRYKFYFTRNICISNAKLIWRRLAFGERCWGFRTRAFYRFFVFSQQGYQTGREARKISRPIAIDL